MSPLSTGRPSKTLFGAIVTIMIAAGVVSCGDGGAGQLPDDDNRGMADAGDGGTMPPNQVFDGGDRYGTATTGEACRSNTTCESGNCVQTADFPGGYCTTSNCSQDDKSCTGEDAVCVDNGQEPSICLDGCTADEDCRDGYECAAHPDVSTDVCVKSGSSPGEGDGYVVGGDDGSPTGAGCDGNGQCEGGTCVESEAFNDGYCTSVGCQSGDCAGNATCVDNSSGPNLCMKLCSDESDCRAGYACEPSESAGSSICVPDGTDPDDGYRVGQPGTGGTGSSCLVDSACRGETCLRTSEFSDGYCTTEGCGPPGTSGSCDGEGGVCVGNSTGPNICLSQCSGDGDCRAGYTCQTASSASGKQVCAPAGTDPDDGYEVGGGPNTGQPCQQNSDCGSGVCMQSDGFEGGYCTEPDCGSGGSGSCEGDATCLDNDRGPNVCLVNCSGDGGCRSGYTCESTGSDDVCVPEGSDPGSGYDVGSGWEGYTGDDCNGDSDCVEGTCVQTKQFPDGYCSTLHCDGDFECSSEDAECKQNRHGTDMCMRDCANGCRNGYECDDSVCVPDGSTLTSGFEPTRHDLGFLCLPEPTGWRFWGQEWTFKFRIDNSTDSYVMVPLAETGVARPLQLDTPSRTVDLQNDYRRHNYSWSLDGNRGVSSGGRYGAVSFAWPIQVPYAPQYDYYVRSGTHELEVLTAGERPCMYVVEEDSRPTSNSVDLNVYTVSNQFSSASLPNNSNWNVVVNRAEDLLQTGDISLGNIDYRSVPASDEQEYRETQWEDQRNEVMGLGERTGTDRDDYLAVDVFVVDDLIREDEGREVYPDGTYGDVPGAPGLHGNPRNGIILNARYLDDQGDERLGYRLAHYLGHYLGLRHTTETLHNTSEGSDMQTNYGTTDPISDTPVCQDIEEKVSNDINNCPDYENLMFPLPPPSNADFTPSLTSDQEEALKANPLVK